MTTAALSLRVFRGAITGAFIATIIAFIGLSIIGVLFAYGGPLLALYYGGYLILYVAPSGMLVGAVLTIFKLIRSHGDPIKGKPKRDNQHARLAALIWMGLPLILIVGLVAIPYVFTNVDRTVTHGARWFFAEDLNEDRFTTYSSQCAVETVVLILTDYAGYDVVCSSAVNRYLGSIDEAIVPITYRVTYDFGEPRSYQLIRVGEVEITWDEWLASPNGCGGEMLPACESAQAQRGSRLDESSWSGDSQQGE